VSALPGLLPSLILVFVGVLATLPVSWSGNVIGHDLLSHLVMSRYFIDQLAAGEWYPRWLAGLNDGLGGPVMFFYGPVPYYITALFRPLVGSDPEGWRQLGLAAALAVMASGFTAYAWLRRLGGDSAALIGALLYMAAPYHLMVDLYQRVAFAELWGFVWMPLMLWQVHAVVEGRRRAVFGLAACYALLIMTHMPTTLLFSAVPPLYALWLSPKGSRQRGGAMVAGGMLLGIGLSAVYLLPALLLQSFVQLDAMGSGKFYYGNNFLFYGPRFDPGKTDGDLHYLGIVMGGMAMVIVGVYELGKRLLPLAGARTAHFWAMAGAIAFFMLLPLSKPVWELLPVLQKVQFPSRFGILLTLSMAALLTLWLGAAGRLLARENITLLVIVGLVGLIQAVPIFNVYRSYPVWTIKPSLNWLEDQMASKGALVKDIVEAAKIGSYRYFLPNGVDPGLLEDVTSFDTLRTLASAPEVAAVLPISGISISQLQLSHVASRHLMLTVRSESPVLLRIRQFYFPGWVATVRGESTELKVRPSRPSGLLEVDVPAGRHDIDLVLQAGPAERAGRIISLISLIVFLAGWARLHYLARGEGRSMPVRRRQVEAADQTSHLKQD
jgi:hypothetical protein